MKWEEVRSGFDPHLNGGDSVEWLACIRRGLATNLDPLSVSDRVIQQILRHANVTTTMSAAVVRQPVAKMPRIEQKLQWSQRGTPPLQAVEIWRRGGDCNRCC